MHPDNIGHFSKYYLKKNSEENKNKKKSFFFLKEKNRIYVINNNSCASQMTLSYISGYIWIIFYPSIAKLFEKYKE